MDYAANICVKCQGNSSIISYYSKILGNGSDKIARLSFSELLDKTEPSAPNDPLQKQYYIDGKKAWHSTC